MNKRIPIRAAKDLAKEFNLDQVILVAYERDAQKHEHMTHVVTYGKTRLDCDQAAQGGNMVKKALGWPEKFCNTKPSRILKLERAAQERFLSALWEVAKEDEEMQVLENLLIKAKLRWRCTECGWVYGNEEKRCGRGHPRPKET